MAGEPPPVPALIQSVTPHPTLIVIQQALGRTLAALFKIQEQLPTVGGSLVSQERDYLLSQVAFLKEVGKWKGSERPERMKDSSLIGQAIAAMVDYALEIKKEGETVMRIKIVVKEVARDQLEARAPPPEPGPSEPALEAENGSGEEPPAGEGGAGGGDGAQAAGGGDRVRTYYNLWVSASRRSGREEHADSIYRIAAVLLMEAGIVPNDYPDQDPIPAWNSGMVTVWLRRQWETPTTFGHWRTHNGWRCPAPLADLANFLWMTRNDPPGTTHRVWVEPGAWEPEPWATGSVDPYLTRADVEARLRDFITACDEIFRAQKWSPAPPSAPLDLGLGSQQGL